MDMDIMLTPEQVAALGRYADRLIVEEEREVAALAEEQQQQERAQCQTQRLEAIASAWGRMHGSLPGVPLQEQATLVWRIFVEGTGLWTELDVDDCFSASWNLEDAFVYAYIEGVQHPGPRLSNWDAQALIERKV